jgi:cysteine synthase B
MYPLIQNVAGNTRLLELQQMNNFANNSTNLVKLEGDNPAGSVKDRPALNMIKSALERGTINQNTHLIEATSGNTGIALAMAACVYNLKITLLMPENSSLERQQAMRAYGAKLVLVSEQDGGMEGARDIALDMEKKGEGFVLNQFANDDNWGAHYKTTAPELWQQTNGKITHFVSSMGTTGTIMGCSRFFKEKNPDIQIIGVQPTEGSQIPGIRRWSPEYLPQIYQAHRVDKIYDVSEEQALETMHKLSKQEGIFAGVSSGGALHIALQIAEKNPNSVVVSIVCDRGDRYLSTGVYDR